MAIATIPARWYDACEGEHMSTKRSLAAALFAVVSTGGLVEGCFSNYHPEYHPESHYRYVQNVNYATTVVENTIAPPASAQVAAAPRAALARSTPAVATAEASAVSSAEAAPRDPPAGPEHPVVAVLNGAPARPTGSQLDEQLAAACLARDAEACKKLAALHVAHRKPGAGSAAPSGYAFDTNVRTLGFRQSVALVAGSNGGTPGAGPRVPLEL